MHIHKHIHYSVATAHAVLEQLREANSAASCCRNVISTRNRMYSVNNFHFARRTLSKS